MSQNVFGTTNMPFVTSNYGGVTSDSAKVTVDNNEKTIRVDVIWKDLLGVEEGKAYPGSLGSRNYEKILELSTQIEQEVSRAQEAELQLQNAIVALENSLTDERFGELHELIEDLKRKDQSLSNLLNSETTRATLAEQQLSELISSEVARIEATTDQLSRLIDATDSKIEDVRVALEIGIEAEKTRAQEAELQLKQSINSFRASSNDSFADIQETIITISNTVAELISNLDALSATSSSESTRIDTVTEVTNTHSEELAKLSDKQQEIVETLSEQSSNISSAVNNISGIQSIIARLSVSTDNLQQLSDTHAELLADLAIRVTSAEGNIASLKSYILAELADTNNAVQDVNTRLDVIGLDVTTQETIVASLRTLVASISQKQQELDSQVQDVDDSINEEVRTREEQVDKLNDDLDAEKELRDKQYSNLSQSDADIKTDIGTFKATINQKVDNLSESTLNKISELTEDISELEAEVKDNKSTVNSRIDELANSISGNDTAVQNDLAAVKQDITEVVTEIGKIRADYKATDLEHKNDIESLSRNHAEEISQLTNKLDNIYSDSGESSSGLLQDEIERSIKADEELQNRLEELELKIPEDDSAVDQKLNSLKADLKDDINLLDQEITHQLEVEKTIRNQAEEQLNRRITDVEETTSNTSEEIQSFIEGVNNTLVEYEKEIDQLSVDARNDRRLQATDSAYHEEQIDNLKQAHDELHQIVDEIYLYDSSSGTASGLLPDEIKRSIQADEELENRLQAVDNKINEEVVTAIESLQTEIEETISEKIGDLTTRVDSIDEELKDSFVPLKEATDENVHLHSFWKNGETTLDADIIASVEPIEQSEGNILPSVVLRDESGRIIVAETPTVDKEATSKKYVNEELSKLQTTFNTTFDELIRPTMDDVTESLSQLEVLIEKHHPISISSMKLKNVDSQYEVGTSVDSIEAEVTVNKLAETIRLELLDPDDKSLKSIDQLTFTGDIPVVTYKGTLQELAVQSNAERITTYTVKVTAEDKVGSITEQTKTVTFTFPIYYGTSSNEHLESVEGLTRKLQTSRALTLSNYDVAASNYIYYIIPASYVETDPVFDWGIGKGGFNPAYDLTVMLAAGKAEGYTYKVYRSENHSLGSVNLKIT